MNMRTLSAFSGLVAALAATTVWGQNSPAQGSTTASAQASGQSTVTAGRGASAQTSTAATAGADGGSAALASGSSVNAVLTQPVDSRRSKPGDAVSARTTQDARTDSGASIPKGSLLMGHIAQVRSESEATSSMAIVFDKAVARDHREIPLRNVAIQAVAAAEASGAAGVADTGEMTSAGGGGMGAGGALGAGRGGLGGGLVGHATGALGESVGTGVGSVAGGAGSLAAARTGALQGGPGATGGLDAAGMLTSQSTGVFGLRGVSLASGTSDAATGSVVTSSGKSVHLDQGTRLLLSSGAGTGARGTSDQTSATSGQASGEGASHRPPGTAGPTGSSGDRR